MLASVAVANDVSEVAPPGADRPYANPVDTPGRRRVGILMAGVLIGVALVIAGVFAATSGIPDNEIVDTAAEFATLPSEIPMRTNPPVVGGLRFPDLREHGWNPEGARRDEVADRLAITVFYIGSGSGRRLAMTILFGQALPPPPGSTVTRSGGIAIARRVVGDRSVVSWRRRGRTTILSAVRTDPVELVRLARIATPISRK